MSDTDNSIASILSRPADEFDNDPTVEAAWASTAVQHMTVYFNLLLTVPDARSLKLTSQDDFIYETFKKLFSELNVASFTEEEIKSESAKVKWREFCMSMANVINDYNFATILRLDSSCDYSEDNSIVVPRAQFVAIEIARNREGFNSDLKAKYAAQYREEMNQN